MSDTPRFQWSKMSPDRGEQIVVRGDDYKQWVLDIEGAKQQLPKVEEKPMIVQKMEEFVEDPKVDMSKAPICPVHKKPMRKGKFPGSWYCPTNINTDKHGEPIWCKEKPDIKTWV